MDEDQKMDGEVVETPVEEEAAPEMASEAAPEAGEEEAA